MPTFLRGIVIAALYVSTLVCLAAQDTLSSHREQPNPAVGDSPETVPPLAHLSPKLQRRAIAVYGVGAFLLAGSELHRLADR